LLDHAAVAPLTLATIFVAHLHLELRVVDHRIS
jgi:hypothetical protein